MKVIIGIVPACKRNDKNPYEYRYSFINNYSKKILKNNALPIGILLNDCKMDEDILNICDGFLFPGGNRFEKFHLEILIHAIKYNKPVLGICLGMQVMVYYDILKKYIDEFNLSLNIDNLWNAYLKIKDDKIFKLADIKKPNIHGYQIMEELVECNIDNINKSKHNISINENSILYKIYKETTKDVYSLHLKKVVNLGNNFTVCAKANDGVIEAIEYKDKNYFILGVQYHAELDDNQLFKYFIKEVRNRKNV